MAVIDDRRIDTILNEEKKLKKHAGKNREALERLIRLKQADPTGLNEKRKPTPLFKKQDLWGLERTSSLVQRHGFNFNIAVMNGSHDTGWDCFGDTQELAPDPLALENNLMDEDEALLEEDE